MSEVVSPKSDISSDFGLKDFGRRTHMKSMTGYGTAEGKVGRGRLFVEVKTVNHRFCEISVKQPPKMGVLESYITKHLKNRYIRGHVDVFVKEKSPLFGDTELTVDTVLARKYQSCLDKLKHELKLKTSDEFLHYVGLDHFVMVKEKEGDYSSFWNQIKTLLIKACDHVDKMRGQEGLHIQKDQKKRVTHIERLIAQIKKRSVGALDRHRHRVRQIVSGGGQMDEQRLETEVAYLGGRQDITEELIRLESHIKQYEGLLNDNGAVGRKLDFLLQEINREVNTIGSKAADAVISRIVVDCKTELERLREQVQNVE